jgi:hypothetical protein
MPTASTRRLGRRKAFRGLPIAGAALCATVAVGCGQSGDGVKKNASDLPTPPGGVIAHVGAYTIDAQAFKTAFGRTVGAEPASTRVMPIPPDFKSCVGRLEGIAKQLNLTVPTRAQLKAKCGERYEQARDSALTSLIQGLWVVEEAKALGLRVDPATARDPAGAGLQAESKRLAKLIGQRISEPVERLSRAQLKLYYEDHPGVFAIPHRRDFKIVRVASQSAARRIKREIEMGRTFASAAKGLPKQPTRPGAFLANYEEGDFREPVLSKAIFAAKLHRIEGPVFVSSEDGYFIFEVLRDHPQYQRRFGSIESRVLQELPVKLRQQRLAAFVRSWAERARAATICTPGYVVAPCDHAGAPATQVVAEAGAAFQ